MKLFARAGFLALSLVLLLISCNIAIATSANETATINLQETKLSLTIITVEDGEVEVKATGEAVGDFAKLWIEVDKTDVEVGEEVTVRLMLRLYRDVRRASAKMVFDYRTDYLDNGIVEVTSAYYKDFRHGYSLQYNNYGDIIYVIGAYDFYISKGTYEVVVLKFRVKKEASCSIRVCIGYKAYDYEGNYDYALSYQVIRVNAYSKGLFGGASTAYYVVGGLSAVLGTALLFSATNPQDPTYHIKLVLGIALILMGLGVIMYMAFYQYPISFLL